MALEDAVAKDVITASARGVDVERMTLRIGCSRATTIVIPVGTLFTSADANTQNMISARTVRVACVESPTPVIKSVDVEVYCINRFKDAPTKTSQFQMSSLSETDPVRELDACLENKKAEHSVRQLAIWMISDDYLDLTQDEVEAKLKQHYEEDVQKQLNQDKSKVLREFRKKVPELSGQSDEEVLSAIQQLNHVLAAKYAREDVANYHDKAGPLLRECGIAISSKKFFQSTISQG